MKKNSTEQSTEKKHEKEQNLTLATADPDTIICAAEEYRKNGYSYPLFAPGCGCD